MKKYHDGFSDEGEEVDIGKMKDEKKAYKKFASAVKVEARSKTKDDNMRSFFVNMPSYQEYVNKSNQSNMLNSSNRSKYERGCNCKNVMMIDQYAFSLMPLQIMVKQQDSQGAEEVCEHQKALDQVIDRLRAECFCGRNNFQIIFVDLDHVSD